MLLFNYKLSAKEALQYGFVNQLYKPAEIQNTVWDKIVEVNQIKSEALIKCKKLIRGQIKDHLLKINEIELKEVNDMHPFNRPSKL